MNKTLYRKVLEEYIDDKLVIRECGRLRYGIPPNPYALVRTDNLITAMENTRLLHADYTLLLDRPYLENRKDFDLHRWYKIKSYVMMINKEICKDSFTMKELMEKLPAEEFLDYCREKIGNFDFLLDKLPKV